MRLQLPRGNVIFSRYQILRELGHGEKCSIYECRSLDLSSNVAVKLLSIYDEAEAQYSQKFRNEVFASYRLRNPNVLRCYEYMHDAGTVGLSMELLQGTTLAELMSSGRQIPIPQCIAAIGQIASGLCAVHTAGIVHTRLTPDNILASQNGDYKIYNFSAARFGLQLNQQAIDDNTDASFLAPEVLESGCGDRRSDVYSFGLVSYYLLTGQFPFQLDAKGSDLSEKLRGRFPEPCSLRRDCPPQLSDFVCSCLRPDPKNRLQSGNECLALFSDLDFNYKRGFFGSLLRELSF